MRLSLIVAMAENRTIGRDGDLPWHLSADLKRFKKLTTGHTIIMGRKTYDSIGRPLPKRRSIVISRDASCTREGAEVVLSLDAALELSKDEAEVFIIGGSSIYELALPQANRLYITQVHTEVDGDVFFPEFDVEDWQQSEELPSEVDEKSGLRYTFRQLERAT